MKDNLVAVLEEHVTPLQRKVRSAMLASLATELTGRELDQGGPERLVSYVLRMKQVAENRLATCTNIEQRWDDFSRRYFRRLDDRMRRQVISDYLNETVVDPVQRRADLAALDRFLDYDALHERYSLERHHLLVAIEIAVTFIANAGIAALDRAASRGRDELVREMLDAGRVEDLLHHLIETGARWQIRRAAIDGLAGFAAGARLRDRKWYARLRSKHLGAAVRIATNPDDHAWVQGSAIRLVLELQPELGLDLAAKRMLDAPAGPHDFLVRRQCVDLLATRAPELLRRSLSQHDPSEHVRQGLAEAFAKAGSFSELRVLCGLDAAIPEPSPRVRAAAVRAACRPGSERPLSSVMELVAMVLERESDPLPLQVACDDIAALIENEPVNRDLAERLLTALLRVASDSERAPLVQETAAAAAERVRRTINADDRAWREYLAVLAQQIRPGRARSVRLSKLRGLPPLPADPTFLGRILAELSRRDFPLAAARVGNRLVVWRGDRFRRRLWRVLHELRTPRPNKRQAHRHTVGRQMKGHLRAPPGLLGEVTPTVVPGERVFVVEEGGWGRHLPTVDDILDVPIWTGDAVRIFSSFGVTTIRPPVSRAARLRNRFAISVRYATLAALRLASLAGTEPYLRQRYADELREHYGIEITFERYDYPTVRALAPARLTNMFSAPSLAAPLQRIVEQPS